MEKGYTLNTIMRKVRRRVEARSMGIEEFFSTLLIILQITTFFILALIFLYLLSREERK
jgi:hypothetical protein